MNMTIENLTRHIEEYKKDRDALYNDINDAKEGECNKIMTKLNTVDNIIKYLIKMRNILKNETY